LWQGTVLLFLVYLQHSWLLLLLLWKVELLV
jgi:hypothetical protein